MIKDDISLFELNSYVGATIRNSIAGTYWVRAETSDVRQAQNGTCYLEFVEKNPESQSIIARCRGTIWSKKYAQIASTFETETGQAFTSGLNVLVKVKVDFHELYGYSLNVLDIDPSFTVGEMAINRRKVLAQLEQDGILGLNKELELPELANRIAVISSPTAAGYEDFCHQLDNNGANLVFYTKLFPAIMQGESSEASIIAALERIFEHRQWFDAVAIIRGGGSTSDLSCFDSYMLAANCAQFPLPIISGIGHERDVTVLDAVAHTRAKTPTAVAEFLLEHNSSTVTELATLEEQIMSIATYYMREEKMSISALSRAIAHYSDRRVRMALSDVVALGKSMRHSTALAMERERHKIREQENSVRLVSPEQVLKRGYSLTLKNGKIVKSATELAAGDSIETLLAEGRASSEVKQTYMPKD